MVKIIAVLVVISATYAVLSISAFSRMRQVISPNLKVGTVPAPLIDMKVQAEDIIETVSDRNWGKVNQDLRMITSDWKSFHQQAVKDGIAPTMLDSLSLTVANLHKTCTSQDVFATMQAGNDMRVAIVDLFCFYHPVILVDVEYLNILERQILVDVQMGNWNATEQTLYILSDVWRRAEPFIIEHDGYSQAKKFSVCMKNLNDALQIKDTMTILLEAQYGLKIVDKLNRNIIMRCQNGKQYSNH